MILHNIVHCEIKQLINILKVKTLSFSCLFIAFQLKSVMYKLSVLELCRQSRNS